MKKINHMADGQVMVLMTEQEWLLLDKWKAPSVVENALAVVNNAANKARRAGNHTEANALVAARVTLYRAAKIGGGLTPFENSVNLFPTDQGSSTDA